MSIILGAKYFNDSDLIYYIQTNNTTEAILKKLGIKGYLETCGPTCLVICCAALIGKDVEVRYPGGYLISIEDGGMSFFHNKNNYKLFREIDNQISPPKYRVDPANTMNNRVPWFYPTAAKELYGIEAEYISRNLWWEVRDYLLDGNSVQLLLEDPGHFIAAVAYDKKTDDVLYVDPWPDRVTPTDGHLTRMKHGEFVENVRPHIIVYRYPEAAA